LNQFFAATLSTIVCFGTIKIAESANWNLSIAGSANSEKKQEVSAR
jgi:hypothetical protein